MQTFSMIIREVGAISEKNRCTFTVWSPLRKKVELILEDNSAHPMAKDGQGYWSVSLDVSRGQYRFRLDGEKILPDPASRLQNDGVHGPSTIVDKEFSWTDDAWKGLSLGRMVIYELHVGTFSKSHDFDGVISKLPYLKDLGINAIEIMPVAQFPGSRNWGYDGVYPFAVQSSYGGPSGLKKLVNAAHREGIAVILDVVYNHQGPEGNYLGEFGPYFTEKYKTGWGKAINFDDAWCDGVRNYYWQNARMWLDEFRIDGLRLDAVHAIWDFSADHFVAGLNRLTREVEKSTGRKKVLIAEFDLNNPRYINPPAKGGYGLDGQWIDEFHHALHSIVTGETDGYYEDFGDISHLAKAYESSYVYTGEYSKHRKKFFGVKPSDNGYDQFVVFAQNHDQVGNRMPGDRLTSTLSTAALRVTAAAYLLSPHVPMLFMGEEYGETNPFQYFISHTDKELVELVRKGRKQEFSYFNWEGEVPDPQSEKTFEQCVLSWDYKHADRSSLLELYKHLIAMRGQRTALQGVARDNLKVLKAEDKILCFERRTEGDYVMIILNFNKEQKNFVHPGKVALRSILDTSSKRWGGSGEDKARICPPDQPITLEPESALVLELQK